MIEFLRNGVVLTKIRRKDVVTITIDKEKPTAVVESNRGFKLGPIKRMNHKRLELGFPAPLREIIISKGEIRIITTQEVDEELLQLDRENEEFRKSLKTKKGVISL